MTKKKVWIYALTDKSGIRYIGKADCVQTRFKHHLWEAYNISGKEYNLPKSKWIRKRACEISYIILEEVEYNQWSNKEKEWISFYSDKTKLLNLSSGGFGGSGIKSEETKNKIREKAIGRKLSLTTRVKQSISKIGKTLYLDKFRVGGKDNPNSKQISQFDLNNKFIKDWDTIKQAATYYNVSPSSIVGCLKNRQKTSAGFNWKYKNN